VYRVLLWQLALTGLAALVAALVGGSTMALSAVVGGLSVCLPNALLLWLLFRVRRMPAVWRAMVLLGGMFAKILFCIALLLAVRQLTRTVWNVQLHWPSIVLTLVVVLQVQVFALGMLAKPNPPRRSD